MDLNADLGEGYGAWRMGDDEALLDVVTSANVACGFHAGDPTTMRRVVRAAVERGVAIGAHVSYPDLRGFGRTPMRLPPERVADDVLYQLGALSALAEAEGGQVAYVKAHGALYHDSARDPELGQALVDAIAGLDPELAVLLPPGSPTARLAEAASLRPVAEGFADRRYRPDGTLVDRREPGAVLEDRGEVVAQARELATGGRVRTTEGSWLELAVGSICVHGDTPGAVALARAVRSGLEDAGITVTPFVPRR